MKKWLPAIFILAAALIFFGVISLPHTGLPHSRAESLQWDGGSRPMTAGESDALAERLAGVKFNIRASGSTTLYMEHITVFFDDRKAQTILYCMEDGTLWLTVGNHRYAGRDAALYDLLRTLPEGLRAGLHLDGALRGGAGLKKKEKREPLFGGSLLRFRPPAGAGVSLLCSARCAAAVRSGAPSLFGSPSVFQGYCSE